MTPAGLPWRPFSSSKHWGHRRWLWSALNPTLGIRLRWWAETLTEMLCGWSGDRSEVLKGHWLVPPPSSLIISANSSPTVHSSHCWHLQKSMDIHVFGSFFFFFRKANFLNSTSAETLFCHLLAVHKQVKPTCIFKKNSVFNWCSKLWAWKLCSEHGRFQSCNTTHSDI